VAIRRLAICLTITIGSSCSRSSESASPAGSPAIVEGFATTPDSVRLYYRVAGTGPETVLAPFALFHGAALDPLAKGRRIVTYDPRGRGRSDSVPPTKVSRDLLLLDLETVRRAVGAERMALIGWSGGGMETFVYTMRNPDRVTRLVQLAPVAARLEPYGPAMMADRRRRTDTVALAEVEARHRAGGYSRREREYCRDLGRIDGPALFASPAAHPETPDGCDFPNEEPSRLSIYFGALFTSIAGFDYRDSLGLVRIPRLVVHGERDNTPLAGNEEWVRGQPNARLLIVKGAGHWPHYEQPAVTLAAIERFLAGNWPAGSESRP
jgi:pimeloyl-ACP methyl ester carboxylesterase